MAIDLIVSSLSKYWSGDYITPVMEEAWNLGADYKIASPTGIKTIPRGTPFGGESAGEERKGLVTFVERIMEALRFEGGSRAWNERSDHFGFYRVDPGSFAEVVRRAGSQFTKKTGLIGRLKGKKDSLSHLASAPIFMPVEFESPLDLEGKVFGSLAAAKKELSSGDWSGIPQDEIKPIMLAFEEAAAEGLPLIVDF
jgi:hypothetical protein